MHSRTLPLAIVYDLLLRFAWLCFFLSLCHSPSSLSPCSASNTGVFSLNIIEVNDAPTAYSASYTAIESNTSPLVFSLTGTDVELPVTIDFRGTSPTHAQNHTHTLTNTRTHIYSHILTHNHFLSSDGSLSIF